MRNPKTMRKNAEKAGVWFVHERLDAVISRKAVQTQWSKVDFFACDIVGKRSDGSHIYVQVTAGQDSCVTARRRKLETIPWHETDTVILLQVVRRKNPANARKIDYFFRVHEYVPSGRAKRIWGTWNEAVRIPPEWFKARR